MDMAHEVRHMAAKKKSSGRPRVPDAQKRLSAVTVRFTRTERARIAKHAKAEGLSIGVWIRHQALLALGAS